VLFGLILFHMFLSVIFSLIAHSSIADHLHDGEGFWHFAGDATLYHREAIIQTQLLNDGLWLEWFKSYKYHLNTKAISILYWLTSVENPLIFELINGPLWVVSIVSIYKSSKLLFNDRTALYVMIFFFQPSILMSSMQLLRDPILIAGFSILCYGWLDFYKNKPNWRNVILIYIGFILIFTMRSYLIPIFTIVFLFSLIWCFMVKNISFFQALLIIIPLFVAVQSNNHVYLGDLGIDKVILDTVIPIKQETSSLSKQETSSLSKQETSSLSKQETSSLSKQETSSLSKEIFEKISIRMSGLRTGFFNINKESGSKIDSEITFKNLSEILNYLPIAMRNGFLSPFPKQWVEEGKQTGFIGRIISGFETVIWYFLLSGFLYVIIRKPYIVTPLAPILLTSIVIIILLGYVVPNVGAIYRMRQGFMIPFFIFGMYGVQMIIHSLLTKFGVR